MGSFTRSSAVVPAVGFRIARLALAGAVVVAGALLQAGPAVADSTRAEVEVRTAGRVIATRRAVFGAGNVGAEGEPRRDTTLIAALGPSTVAVALDGMVIIMHSHLPATQPTERELVRAAALAPAIVTLGGLDGQGALSAPAVLRTGALLLGTAAQCVALGMRDAAASARCHAFRPAGDGPVVARIAVSAVDLATPHGRPAPAWRFDGGGRSVLWRSGSVDHLDSTRRCDNAVTVVHLPRSIVLRLPCASRPYDVTT